ncbi:hypothetical protein LPN04_04990 [Rugamonas sp. A1-17]|nr:hypothetical protein [Rugamonas sp. A1-17]
MAYLIWQSPAHGDAAALAASVSEWNRLMGLLDAHLAAGGPFVCGPWL